MATAASQMNVYEVINTSVNVFWKFISPRGWPYLAAMHDRVTKDRRVLTLQVNDHCIINIFLKDILLKTKLLNHAFFKKPSSMGVFNSAIVQWHDTHTAKSLFVKLDEGGKKKRRHNDSLLKW